MSYKLGYNQDDYNPIGSPALDNWTNLDVLGTGLYNGNITKMTTQLQGLQSHNINTMAYQYDQLHRIKQAKSYEYNVLNNKLNSNYNYDANGNLLSLNRNRQGQSMDELVYQYSIPNGSLYGGLSDSYTSNDVTQPNTLLSVSDAIDENLFENDVDDQISNNYIYDQIGNLTFDASANMTINWDVYGKVKNTVKEISSNQLSKTKFTYDGVGNRITKKVSISNNGIESPYYSKTYYMRDASGNVMSIYTKSAAPPKVGQTGTQISLTQKEIPLYGSSRLGNYNIDRDISISVTQDADTINLTATRTYKNYELSNHLGNVLTTISDRKLNILNTGLYEHSEPEYVSSSDYYPFGMQMSERTISSSSYRYGFNGKEKDEDDEFGNLTTYDYGFRIYNPGIGKFLSVDPLTGSYPWYTPYQFAGNTPLQSIDIDGAEIYGYISLKKNDNWAFSLKVISSNDVWINYLRSSFAVMGEGDNIGQKSNGKYAGIQLDFDINKSISYAIGITELYIMHTDGSETLLIEADGFKKGDSFRIKVSLDKDNSDNSAQLLTIPHEVILHADKAAKKIKEFQKGTSSFVDLKNYALEEVKNQKIELESVKYFDPEIVVVEGHIEIGLGTNIMYEAVNDKTEIILDAYIDPVTVYGQMIDGVVFPTEKGVENGRGVAKNHVQKGSDLFKNDRNSEATRTYSPEKIPKK